VKEAMNEITDDKIDTVFKQRWTVRGMYMLPPINGTSLARTLEDLNYTEDGIEYLATRGFGQTVKTAHGVYVREA
jgi:hypothetical protein